MIFNPLDVAIMNERFILWLLLVPLKCYLCNADSKLYKSLEKDHGCMMVLDLQRSYFQVGFCFFAINTQRPTTFPKGPFGLPPCKLQKANPFMLP